MRKALVPMLVSLALCGAATTAMVISSANAQPGARVAPAAFPILGKSGQLVIVGLGLCCWQASPQPTPQSLGSGAVTGGGRRRLHSGPRGCPRNAPELGRRRFW